MLWHRIPDQQLCVESVVLSVFVACAEVTVGFRSRKLFLQITPDQVISVRPSETTEVPSSVKESAGGIL